jgi:hypothetical protein
LQSQSKRVPNEPIPTYGHRWPSTPECSFKIGDRQSEKKWWNCDGRVICNATCGIGAGRGVSRHRDVSDHSDRLRSLWRSHSARTELFFADAPDNYMFLSYCEHNDIVVFCLPPCCTHLLQSHDTTLLLPIQLYYWNPVDNDFLTTTVRINCKLILSSL